jgi:hypothetical protein
MCPCNIIPGWCEFSLIEIPEMMKGLVSDEFGSGSSVWAMELENDPGWLEQPGMDSYNFLVLETLLMGN